METLRSYSTYSINSEPLKILKDLLINWKVVTDLLEKNLGLKVGISNAQLLSSQAQSYYYSMSSGTSIPIQQPPMLSMRLVYDEKYCVFKVDTEIPLEVLTGKTPLDELIFTDNKVYKEEAKIKARLAYIIYSLRRLFDNEKASEALDTLGYQVKVIEMTQTPKLIF